MKTQPTNKEIEKVADKVIKCNACEWLQKSLGPVLFAKMDVIERKAVHAVQMAGFNILPGAPYIQETGTYHNKPYTSNYIKEIHEICLKYDLYSYTGKTNAKLN